MSQWCLNPSEGGRIRRLGDPCLNAEGYCAAGLYCSPRKQCERLPFYQACPPKPGPRDPRNNTFRRGDDPHYFANVAKRFSFYE